MIGNSIPINLILFQSKSLSAGLEIVLFLSLFFGNPRPLFCPPRQFINKVLIPTSFFSGLRWSSGLIRRSVDHQILSADELSSFLFLSHYPCNTLMELSYLSYHLTLHCLLKHCYSGQVLPRVAFICNTWTSLNWLT